MATYTYGSGNDLFTIETEGSVSNTWSSEQYQNNRISRFELSEVTCYYNNVANPWSGWEYSRDNMPIDWDVNNRKIGVYNTSMTDELLFGANALVYNNAEVVKECDIQRLVWSPPVIKGTENGKTVYSLNMTDNQPHVEIMKADGSGVVTTVGINPIGLHPDYTNRAYNIMNNVTYVIDLWNNYTQRSNGIVSETNAKGHMPLFEEINTYPYENNQTVYALSKDEKFQYKLTYSALNYANARFELSIVDEDLFKKILACYGLKFKYDGVIYKPVIQQGVVVGYTDDMDAESDFDNWHGIHDHVVPDVRPEPIPPKDLIDAMTPNDFGVGVYGAINYYRMSFAELNAFVDALQEATTEHPDIESAFVCCYHVPYLTQSIVAGTNMTVTAKGVQLTGATGDKIITQKAVQIASFKVPKRHRNALDNLTKYFIYTPFTDVIPLNYKCYGRTISVWLIPSIKDVTASILVQADGLTIAKQTVSLGNSEPIAIENNAEKSTAIVNACSKYLASAGGVIGGALTGNLPAVAGGAIGVVASTVNALNAIGNTYIHSYGVTTGDSLSLNPDGVYMIEYYVETDKPANFASTVGNLCNKEMTLSENMGYTVCDNPKIYGTMSLAERTEIENYLRTGVIL